MRRQSNAERRCSYIVSVDRAASDEGELRSLARYLSKLGVAGCQVIVFDSTSGEALEQNRRFLCWVGTHVPLSAPFDIVRAAADAASCDRIIIAASHVRYDGAALKEMCELLDEHEVVEPQEYVDPLPWWGGVEAGRMLVHRSVDAVRGESETFGFRRSAFKGLHLVEVTTAMHPVRRLAAFGAEVFTAFDTFIRRTPPALSEWIRERPRAAGGDFDNPVKTAFFFALIPTAILLAVFSGLRVTAGYVAAIAFGSIVLAIRGRGGAAGVFPWRACLYAPLWVVERSISVYWALLSMLRRAAAEPSHTVYSERRGEKAASGE